MSRVVVLPGPWRDLHAAKNDLAAAKLLLHCAGSGAIDVPQIEALIMQASTKIDELAFDDAQAPSGPAGASAAEVDRLRKIYEKQAELHEESALILAGQAVALERRAALADLLAEQKREEAALARWEPEQQRLLREVAAFERAATVLRREIDVLQAQRECALAQAATARQKTRLVR